MRDTHVRHFTAACKEVPIRAGTELGEDALNASEKVLEQEAPRV